MRVDRDGQIRCAGQWVSAKMSLSRNVARGQIQVEGAKVDGAVTLGVCSIDDASGGRFAAGRLGWRVHFKFCEHRECVDVAIDPGRGGGTVEAAIESETLVRRLAHEVEDRIDGNVFELRGNFAIDGNRDLVGGSLEFGLRRGRAFPSEEGFLCWRRSRLELGSACDGREPVDESDGAFHLSALTQTSDDG